MIRPFLTRLVKRGLFALFGAQVTVISTLIAIDAWRKRFRAQGAFPRTRLNPVVIGDNELRVFSYGEDVYDAMLYAIRHAQRRVLLETFIWKGDEVGTRFKNELIAAAERGVEVYVIFDGFANLVVPRTLKQFPNTLHVLEFPVLPKPWIVL